MTTPAAAGDRIEGLNLWRALLMLGGIALHATMGHEDYSPFTAINIVSNAFRMGAFFVISGLLAGFATRRRADPGDWLRQRLIRLGVPTVFGLTVLCPLTSLMLSTGLIGQTRTAAFTPNLFHLWFLVALIGYTLVAYGVETIDRRVRLFERIDERLCTPHMVRLTLLLGGGASCFILMVIGVHLRGLLPDAASGLGISLHQILGYLPLYAVGYAAARMPCWRRQVLASMTQPVAVIAVVVLANLLWWCSPLASTLGEDTARWLEDIVIIGTASWCAPAVAMLMLRSASAIRLTVPVIHRLSSASFTMYLHYPLIVATKIVIAPLLLHPWLDFALSVAVGGGLSYWFHHQLVERQPFLALLFNGRWYRPSRDDRVVEA